MMGTYAVKVESRDLLAVKLQNTDLFSLWDSACVTDNFLHRVLPYPVQLRSSQLYYTISDESLLIPYYYSYYDVCAAV